jgi:DNA invertase Pin-like site-specific DNA recombinase
MAKRVKQGDPKRAVGYIRVSTGKQDISPEVQREALERYCAAEGIELAEVFTEVVSTGIELDKRPELLDAVNACKELGAGILLGYKRDRLGRHTVDMAVLEKMTTQAGARICTTDGSNGDSPEDELQRNIKDAFAQYERAQIRARTRAALRRQKSKGYRVGTVPYGYQVDSAKRLAPLPEEQAVIERIRELREAGSTIRGIAQTLNTAAVPARGKRWYPTTVSRLLAA